MLIVASVLICIGCFLQSPGGTGSNSPKETDKPIDIRTIKPYETETPGDATPTPDGGFETPTPTDATPTETPEETPAQNTPVPTVWPRIEFPVIKNVDFMNYGTTFDHFSTKWETGADNQNRAVIYSRVKEIIKNVDYVFYTIGEDEDWDHYMTFILHYDYGYTDKLLDLLKRYDVKAVFFVTKDYIANYPDKVIRMKNEGHIIGNRGIIGDDNIKQLTAETFAEGLLAVEQEYQKLFGATERMYLFRTDYFNERLLKVAEAMGYTVVFRTYTYQSDASAYKDKSAEDLAVWFDARAGYNGTVSEFMADEKCYKALEIFISNCIDQGIKFKLVERRH